MTGTLAAPLARALALHGVVVDDWQEQYTVDHGLARDILAHLRSDPEVLAALAEALHEASRCSDFPDHTAASHSGHAAALLDVLLGKP